MINPYDKNINWNDRAKDEMTLLRMIDTSLIEGDYSIPHIKYKPSEPIQSGHFGLKAIYMDHSELLNEIVKIFFPTEKFTPSEINKEGSNEFFLFIVISAIHDIVWFNNIEDSRPRGYEKELEQMKEALYFLYPYGDCKEIDETIEFPAHRNETIDRLDNFFIGSKRIQQGKKVKKAIKEHFGIKSVNATDHKKMINANKKLHEKLKSEHGFTDEQIKHIPILGQLQTKI